MYLTSPQGSRLDDLDGYATGYNTHYDDSDDSLASDASSAPSRPEHPYGNGEAIRNIAHFQHDKTQHKIKLSADKKPCKHMGKRRNEGSKVEDKHDVTGRTSATTVLSRGKVRKTNRMHKGK
ncbi:hypothetical protein Sjap_015258 [Stephania japonica]|uniref:Uncharacterized protein n=1 Tax=Stephania japonica TaxID=461633 RepID=A0AAP0IKD2_9MAGN